MMEVIWSQLHQAMRRHGHGWKTPALATMGLDDLPQVRAVVLRELDQEEQSLRIYTDERSPKVGELRRCPSASFCFWDQESRLQLRLQGQIHITCWSEGPDEHLIRVWEKLKNTPNRQDYTSLLAPGSPVIPSRSPEVLVEPALAILTFKIAGYDLLKLDLAGHQRAYLDRCGMGFWMTP